MNRKWTVLTVTAAAITLLATGFSMAQEEHSPLAQLMEKVSATSNLITKAVRTPVAYKKSQKDVVAHAAELAKLAQQAREIKDAVKKATTVPDADKQWTTLMDQFIAASNDLAKVASKGTQIEAKKANTAVKAVCTDCHSVFRVEEDAF